MWDSNKIAKHVQRCVEFDENMNKSVRELMDAGVHVIIELLEDCKRKEFDVESTARKLLYVPRTDVPTQQQKIYIKNQISNAIPLL